MPTTLSNPLALIAELTHRCPLALRLLLKPAGIAVTHETNSLPKSGPASSRKPPQPAALQADFNRRRTSRRPDIVELVRAARSAGLYVNLITSGLPVDETKLAALVEAGLDHFQLKLPGRA